jgi:predicted kinase
MQQVIILSGISGSGKSAYAKWLVEKDKSYVRVNRDSYREMLVGYKDFYKRDDVKVLEDLITKLQKQAIETILDSGKNLIVDNTHLSWKYIRDLIDFINSKHSVLFTITVFETDVNVCKNRVFRRDFITWMDDDQEYVDYSNEPDTFYIDKQQNAFNNLLTYLKTNQLDKNVIVKCENGQ